MSQAKKTTTPKRSKTSESQILPPCKVCGGKAVGFHFGVNTCAACKSFFKRMVKKPVPTQACEGKCEAQPGRAQCIYCRYTRCVQAGMSTAAAKRGRYSQHTKIENMIAAQSAKESSKINPPFRRETSDSSTGSLPTGSGDESHNPSLPQQQVSSSPDSGNFSSHVLDEDMPSPVNFYDCNINSEDNKDFSDFNIEEVMPLDFNFSLPKTEPMYRSKVPPEQLQGLTDYLEKIHNQYVTVESDKVAMNLSAKYKEEKGLRMQLFGSLKPLEWEEYKRVYTETGLDIDGRKRIVENAVKGSKKLGEKFFGFCLDIPGFKDLPLDDQKGILSNNHMLFALMMDYQYVNVEEKIYASPMKDHTIGEDEFSIYMSKGDIDLFFQIMGKLQSYHLTTKQKALMTAALILLPDNGRTLAGKQHLAHAQMVLLDAMRYQFSKTHPNCPHIMEQTEEFMYTMRMEFVRMYLVWQERMAIMTGGQPGDLTGQEKETPKPGTSQQSVTEESRRDYPCGQMSDAMLIKMLKMTDPSNLLENDSL